MDKDTADSSPSKRIPGTTEQSLNFGKSASSPVWDLVRDTSAVVGAIMNRIREVVPFPLKVHSSRDGRLTTDGLTASGSGRRRPDG